MQLSNNCVTVLCFRGWPDASPRLSGSALQFYSVPSQIFPASQLDRLSFQRVRGKGVASQGHLIWSRQSFKLFAL